MNAFLVGLFAVAIAYLIGAIPFGYLVARAVKGIDIRTVGSGNIGATNVGRTLGFRYFLLVFALDLAKGLLPTLFLAKGIDRLGLPVTSDLSVFVGLAAILGHNFPIYLGFKGGKGVATSLGVLFALDLLAALAALVGFVVFLGVTGFVSLSSILGGLCFVAVHFARVEEPLSRSQLAMTVVTLSLMGLVIIRHRANLKRIAQGTEPKVKLRKQRSGSARIGLILSIFLVSSAILLTLNYLRKNELTLGTLRLFETARLATGYQRAERLAFLDQGRLLAITCPRYGRVVLASVADSDQIEVLRDIRLEGRPVAIAAHGGKLHVLQRPNGDQRHLEEAYWDVFDLKGEPNGQRMRLGYDPDDLAFSADGQFAYVLTSGHAEGETGRPQPALTVYRMNNASAEEMGRLEFTDPHDDPARLALRPDGRTAAVSLQGSRAVAWIDLSDPQHPRLKNREPLQSTGTPEAVWFDPRGRLWIADPEGATIGRQQSIDGPLVLGEKLGNSADIVALNGINGPLAISLPKKSAVALVDQETGKVLGQLPVRGTANLAATRPLGLAVAPERGLMAVANRAGGSVHLFRIHDSSASTNQLADASGASAR